MSRQQYIITRMQNQIYSFLQDEKRAVEIHCDAPESGSLLGNIYIGRILNIAKNLNAAFVEIAPGEKCYLSLEDMKNPVYTRKGASKLPQQGDELLVQISRESIKTKLPSVSTNLTLHGKYVLLTTGNTQFSVSSKLSKEDRTRLLDFADKVTSELLNQEVLPDPASQTDSEDEHSFGWLLRTNAGNAEESLLRKDMQRLYEQYKQLIAQARFRTCFSCMLCTPPSYITRLSDLYDSQVERVLTDDPVLFQEIEEYLKHYQPEDLPKLHLYQDDLLSMNKLYSLERQLAEALSEKVWLKSGGYLIISPTEALTVIDVNSGKADGGKHKEEALLKINKEAAAEIAHQLRLRNMSGIIIVDFINMKQKESIAALLSLLDSELKKDPIRTVLVDITRLSLVEITRMKKEKPLHEAVKNR